MNQRFLNIIKSSRPVLVDFYADWCLPCREITPLLKKVKQDVKGGIKIIKVNVDEYPQIASCYNVDNIPTLMVFRNGTPQWKKVGICKADEIKSVIHAQINAD